MAKSRRTTRPTRTEALARACRRSRFRQPNETGRATRPSAADCSCSSPWHIAPRAETSSSTMTMATMSSTTNTSMRALRCTTSTWRLPSRMPPTGIRSPGFRTCCDCQLFKLQPAGHHLMSVAIHAANSLLLFLILLRMTARLGPGRRSRPCSPFIRCTSNRWPGLRSERTC